MDTSYIITVVIVTLFSLILFLASIYSLFILFNHHFHHHNNMFILNICLNIISACIYFIIYFIMFYFNYSRLYALNTCNVVFYAYLIAGSQIPFSFVTFSIHRYCSIVHYGKPFFKTKRWVGICIASQWIGVFIISLPYAFRKQSVSIC
jgi:hypothetical protein